MLGEILADFEDQGGLEFKMLLNDVQKEAQAMKQESMPLMKTKEESRDELEEIETLMDRLKQVKSRTERRRLLAQFNKKQAKQLQWGQKATFGTRNELVAYSDRFSQLLMAQEADQSLIWNPAVRGYVNKKLYEKALATPDPT